MNKEQIVLKLIILALTAIIMNVLGKKEMLGKNPIAIFCGIFTVITIVQQFIQCLYKLAEWI